MRLRAKQSLLVVCQEKLYRRARLRGWEFTLGEAHVISPREVWAHDPGEFVDRKQRLEDAEHMEGSLHYSRLAIDLNLFVNGRYITSGRNPAYVELGAYWEGLSPWCAWGGRFGDANHFSIKHGGRR